MLRKVVHQISDVEGSVSLSSREIFKYTVKTIKNMSISVVKRMKAATMIVVVLLINSSVSLAQCAMCRGSVETNMSTGSNVIGNGINAGIAYLFMFPYLAVGLIGYLWYRNSKKILAERIILQRRVKEAYNHY
jgi:hypothetical protein